MFLPHPVSLHNASPCTASPRLALPRLASPHLASTRPAMDTAIPLGSLCSYRPQCMDTATPLVSPDPTGPHAWTLPSHWGPPTLQTPMHGHCHPIVTPSALLIAVYGHCHPIVVPAVLQTLPSHCGPFGPIECSVWMLPSSCGPSDPKDHHAWPLLTSP